jgi:hypothetical protein
MFLIQFLHCLIPLHNRNAFSGNTLSKKNIAMKQLAFITLILFLVSCGRKEGEMLTERIQYDVTIKSPETDLAWWVQNLEGPKREKFVKALMESARAGKVKVYDVMSNQPLTAEEVGTKGTKTELLTFQRPYEPYEIYDTLVTRELQLSDISRVRFLEQWQINPENGKIHKEVLAICPLVESYTETGELRGYMPLFWLSYQKNFPLEVN